ncbi:MAG TPA: GAF domain-containing protein [Thermoanaerobaculia bacterium]|jgi:GAF domain-containing protein|nr:GAF domain-containing protein [Thermoanaerobaculia bacterium]
MEQDKETVYRDLLQQLGGVLPGCHGDPVAIMASTACLLHAALPYASWAGFYRVVAPRLLRVGPYQGPLGCLEIAFERGVCGAAARQRATQLVPDVDTFPGHIACDEQARAELVVPVVDRHGELVAVLDLDSRQPAAFDEADRAGLEAVARLLAEHL